MSEVFFYHMTETTLDEALPGLVEKSLGRGWRAVIQTGGAEKRDHLDGYLWTYRPDSFVAHACDGGERPADQPVFLTVHPENPNGARIRFLVDGAAPPDDLSGYDRVVLMFDGLDDQALSEARGHWKSLKEGGHVLAYYKQNSGGGWERAA